jgi:hypothetical protein
MYIIRNKVAKVKIKSKKNEFIFLARNWRKTGRDWQGAAQKFSDIRQSKFNFNFLIKKKLKIN